MAAVIAPRVTNSRSLKDALAVIGGKRTLFESEEWPEVFEGLAPSGLYGWFVDAAGAKELSEGIGLRVKTGCIFAGEAGATSWPTGRASRHTLCSQIERDQLNGPVARTNFRLTLAAALKKPLKLKKSAAGKLADSSEAKLTAWMHQHLSLAVYQCVNQDELADLQERVMKQLDPPLNVFGMPASDVRVKVSQLRKLISD